MKNPHRALYVGLLSATLLAVCGVLIAGNSVASFAPTGAVTPAATTAAGSTGNNTFNFSSPHPHWNAGNLCTPVASATGKNVTCTYSGNNGRGGHGYGSTIEGTVGCGCKTPPPLTYNFSSPHKNYVVNISNLGGQNVYLNFDDASNSITIQVSGCSGGSLTVAIKSEATVNLVVSSSSVKVDLTIYSNHDHYYGWISGSHDQVWTDFVSANTKYNECPAENNSATDTYWVNLTGRQDAQAIVFVSAVGPGSSLNSVYVGDWNSVWFENSTSFTCSWAYAPPSNCHGGMSPVAAPAASRRDA